MSIKRQGVGSLLQITVNLGIDAKGLVVLSCQSNKERIPARPGAGIAEIR